ncbi:MAG: OsmC family protein [Anaerolineales bacterium]|nr:OsmC family protein [Anaerolineales bacterium]MCS7249022.1 OsmC family protein [Anaerolineales bacterium]MDW8162835.1 OsmC family protein [Anaerolineales bacterium]MDW8446340.1 OsmC family protein [Anaerolineales bacterium]
MQVEVTWKGRLSFNGNAESGFTLPLGTTPDVGGDNDGFRPMELMALSLAGCTAMDVISILSKKRQEVHEFRVAVKAERATDHPKVFTRAVIEYHVAGKGVQEEAVVRAIELSATRYCPAQAMLRPVLPIELAYFIYEIQDDGSKRVVVEGTYHPSAT